MCSAPDLSTDAGVRRALRRIAALQALNPERGADRAGENGGAERAGEKRRRPPHAQRLPGRRQRRAARVRRRAGRGRGARGGRRRERRHRQRRLPPARPAQRRVPAAHDCGAPLGLDRRHRLGQVASPAGAGALSLAPGLRHST